MNELFVAAFILGITGSLHCVGMCGPLILAANSGRINQRWKGLAVYHFGRIATYGGLGFVFGILGAGFRFAGFQQSVSISSGIILLTVLILGFFKGNLKKFFITDHFLTWLKRQFTPFLKGTSLIDKFMVGVLNGWLPCGLVYIALTAALVSGNVGDAVISMLIFGFGTMPILALTSSLWHILGKKFSYSLKLISPIIIAIIGCLLILRGLDLGIPFISPDLSARGMH